MIAPDDIRHFRDVDVGTHGHAREKRKQRPIELYARDREQARINIEPVNNIRDGDQ